jgi:PKD repeat protein
VNEVQGKARIVKASIALLLIASLAAFVSGCWPFNEAPLALFTASTLTGRAPLTVSFTAIRSSDSDGIIAAFDWDFGDGSSASEESVSHTYTTAETRTVVLTVTDDDGARATASKTITVLPPANGDGDADGTLPVASFTATPGGGTSPVTITFNGSSSYHTGFTIVAYFWDFGDGGTTQGNPIVDHRYYPTSSQTYHVVLRVVSSDNNREGTKSMDIRVTVNAPPGTSGPTALFDLAPTTQVAPLAVTFDPGHSSAPSGRTLDQFTWTFGDGTPAEYYTTDQAVTHHYTTDQASKAFEVRLRVVDSANDTDTEIKTATIENYQPVAGFEILDQLNVQTPPGIAGWVHADKTFSGVTAGQRKVWIQSLAITDAAWTRHFGGVGDPVVPTPATKTGSPAGYHENNFSYDPEGQWFHDGAGTDNPPAGWTSHAWGIQDVRVDWGDGVQAPYSYTQLTNMISHDYTFAGTTTHFHITLTVYDFLGGRSSLMRTITLEP